ncbi:MAG TPA: GntR family transcriptional regulator [Thermoleophilaceae bacterium]|nr:GntR family transcriptional regulator [Thermoleophilaceae bacterium]
MERLSTVGGLDREEVVPLYYQLEAVLEQRILEGVWAPLERLPSERELCEEFGVSRAVVRPALDILERQGHIVRVQGSGTFVAPPKRTLAPRGLVPMFIEPIPVDVEVNVLTADERQAEVSESPSLELAGHERLLQVFATIVIASRPACMLNTTIVLERVPFLGPILREGARLSGCGPFGDVSMGPARTTVEGGICTELEAQQLELSPGSHVFVANILQSGEPGPLESAWAIYPADSVRLEIPRACSAPAPT